MSTYDVVGKSFHYAKSLFSQHVSRTGIRQKRIILIVTLTSYSFSFKSVGNIWLDYLCCSVAAVIIINMNPDYEVIHLGDYWFKVNQHKNGVL